MNQEIQILPRQPLAENTGSAARPRLELSKTAGITTCLRLGLVGVFLAGLGGCTFVEQTQDVLEGGPEQRVTSAEQRQADALAAQSRLNERERELAAQLAVDEEKLATMRQRLQDQDERISRARANQRVAEEEEQQLLARVAKLESEIQALYLAIQVARATGDEQNRERLEERLRALEMQAEEIEADIRLLE